MPLQCGCALCFTSFTFCNISTVVPWYQKRIYVVPLPVFHWKRYLLRSTSITVLSCIVFLLIFLFLAWRHQVSTWHTSHFVEGVDQTAHLFTGRVSIHLSPTRNCSRKWILADGETIAALRNPWTGLQLDPNTGCMRLPDFHLNGIQILKNCLKISDTW